MIARAIWRGFGVFGARFAADERGVSAILVGLVATSLIGMIALGVEGGLWYKIHADMQSAADAAALGAATAQKAGESASAVEAEAWAEAKANGFPITSVSGAVGAGANSLTVTVNTPPTSGGYTSNGSAVQVLISQPQTLFLAGAFLHSGPTISAGAVAGTGTGPACVLVTDTSGTSVTMVGVSATLSSCNMQVNSSSSPAFSMTGGSLTATAVDIVGHYTNTGGTISSTPTTGVAAVSDPFASLSAGANTLIDNNVPPTSGSAACTNAAYPSGVNQVGGSVTLNPKSGSTVVTVCGSLSGTGATINVAAGVTSVVVQGGISLTGSTLSFASSTTSLAVSGGVNLVSGTLTLPSNANVFVDGGTLSNTGGTLNGTADTIFLACAAPPCGSGSSYANATLTGGTTTLTAPTSGTYSGIVFYQDPTDTNHTGADTMTGGNNSYEGTVYLPDQALSYTGGSSAAACTQIVAYTMTWVGSSVVNYNCTGDGLTTIQSQGGGNISLLE